MLPEIFRIASSPSMGQNNILWLLWSYLMMFDEREKIKKWDSIDSDQMYHFAIQQIGNDPPVPWVFEVFVSFGSTCNVFSADSVLVVIIFLIFSLSSLKYLWSVFFSCYNIQSLYLRFCLIPQYERRFVKHKIKSMHA